MTSDVKCVPLPAGLGDAGAKLWSGITGKYTLRADELRVLEDACQEADLVDDLHAAAQGAERIVKGSMGQPVINPLISELRQHRSTLAALLRQLKLPDDQAPASGSGRPTGVVNPARKAAHARWKGLPS